ncbi:cytochrome C oxidase subunit IV family protein [Azospirillum rugosum]|uniref:Cytochrome c oxidase subunit 4 n=1 Tax=Azospirillum rugosum TaxID=416170 RepID=A0ABS4SJ95_9PROT|nr:cytochrome C oxidase subunit IV family protein [Azospirillum rugosum]MBP2292634.1 cytochrome c oxidase subunit 4 [Azospirillum rugosum]MDQ0526342.1 cytochrome c oxidase subunit 4 [Azospirillum rugosum]
MRGADAGLGRPPRALVLTWLALLGLVALTLGLAYVPLGRMGIVVALAIAAVKAGLVVTLFMKLFRGPVLARVAAGAGLFWLAILFSLAATDYLARNDAATGNFSLPTGREGSR